MPTGNYVILAPHIDDELIGCFSLLRKGLVSDVYYFYDLDEQRIEEAKRLAKNLGFTPHFLESYPYTFPEDKILLLPNIADLHPHHKNINTTYRREPNEKVYYSIDMNVKNRVLGEKERSDKLDLLRTYYPSQSKLIEGNDKYHLFESILETDLMVYKIGSTKSGNTLVKETRLFEVPKALLDEIEEEIQLSQGRQHIQIESDKFLVEYKP